MLTPASILSAIFSNEINSDPIYQIFPVESANLELSLYDGFSRLSIEFTFNNH